MLGHRKRLRERYLKLGYKGLEEYEFLELILTYSIKMKDCKGLAKKLLEKFKNISGVLNASIEELEEIEGIGKETAIYLKVLNDIFLNENFRKTKKKDILSIKGKRDLIEYLKTDMGDIKNEEFKIIYLNNDNKIVCDEVIFKGTINRSVIYPRKIMERVINTKARGVIFVHNHPSGNLTPSKKDIEITLEMQELLEKIDVKLLDHIIVSEDDYYSFQENGMIY